MPSLHDSGYKILFANRTIFRQLIETFVPEAWVQEADFDRCEKVDKSFVAEHYKATESDLIYKVPLRDKEVYIYVLMEFQSTVDRFMTLRVLHYLSSFYLDYVQSGRRVRTLPPVFPIVLYNGDRKWTAPTRIEELVNRHDLLGRFGVSFEYFKIAENEFSRERLLKIRNIVSTLFLAETHYDIEVLSQELVALFDRQVDKQAVSLFLNWFRQLAEHDRIEESDYEVLSRVYTDREEVQSMLANAIRRERQKIYEEGRKEEQYRIARAMLAEGMSLEQIARITGLSEKEVRDLQREK
jgi:predicted transposase/invertase (TIGR01784 family)